MKKWLISITLLLLSSPIFTVSKGILLGDKMNIRQRATTRSRVVANLRIGTAVYILKQNRKKIKIGALKDSWVKIKTKRGRIGYIFGAYIFKLSTLYKKKWEASSPSGDSFYKYYFKKNGTYICKMNYPYGSPGYYKDTIYGVYKRKGRILYLQAKKSTKNLHSKRIEKIYLYRKKGKAILSFTKFTIGQKNINPFELIR